MNPKKSLKTNQRQWFNMDIHLHTPASMDFQQPEVTNLDILKASMESVKEMMV